MENYSILDTIRKMNDSTENTLIVKYENMLVMLFFCPILFIGSILKFLIMHLIFNLNMKDMLIDSLFLFGIFLCFQIFNKLIKNEMLKSHIFTVIFSCMLMFIVLRIYPLIGATVWTIAFILIMVSMLRINKSMLIIISFTTLILNIFVWHNSYAFQMGTIYYLTQIVSFILLFGITLIVHKINSNRYYRINEQFQEVIKKNEQISSSEKEAKHLAYHDHLTMLPNRLFLSEKLNHAISLSSRMEKILAVMFLDLDHFKMINDTMGHDTGDELLVQVSKRLGNTLRNSDTVARIGGDEFIILIEDVEDLDYISVISDKILKRLNEPFSLNNQDCFVTTSIGVAIYPTDGTDAEELLKNADIAMYKAKGKGRNQYALCTQVMKIKIAETMKTTNSLYRALERSEFELYYQPQLNCTSNKIVGLEALIRWNHPELGLVLPLEFISIAEQTGLIIPIGEWVLRTACKQNKAWQDAGFPRIRMGVNLSAKQFQNDNLVNDVEGILKETGLDYRYLELEITESAAMNGEGHIIETLSIFKKMGINIAIDDFGTEYSSLNYLKQLPADRIKIPMTFIQGIGMNTKDEAITKAIIILAKNMGLGVIAEGVETKNQLDFLNQGMCDEIQGFYYFKPMPAHKVEELLKNPLVYDLKSTL
jgi:diguanylate cyclase (GGDEF)-like protein